MGQRPTFRTRDAPEKSRLAWTSDGFTRPVVTLPEKPGGAARRDAGELRLRYDNRTVARVRPSVCRDC
jgi:hypothetical protein